MIPKPPSVTRHFFKTAPKHTNINATDDYSDKSLQDETTINIRNKNPTNINTTTISTITKPNQSLHSGIGYYGTSTKMATMDI